MCFWQEPRAETKDGSVPALPAEYDSVVSWHHGHFCSACAGGTYIVETVFSYPGIGTLAYESARYKDYNLLMLLCLMSGIVVILCNMAAQIINERIDPRMREKEAAETSEVMML